jgi:hypothetical protein
VWRALSFATVTSLGVLATLAAASVTVGRANSLGSGSKGLGNGSAAVSACYEAEMGIVQNLSSSNVVSVKVSGIAAACGNAPIKVTLNNGTTSSSGSGTVPAGGGEVTVTITSIAAKDAEEIDVSIEGP